MESESCRKRHNSDLEDNSLRKSPKLSQERPQCSEDVRNWRAIARETQQMAVDKKLRLAKTIKSAEDIKIQPSIKATHEKLEWKEGWEECTDDVDNLIVAPDFRFDGDDYFPEAGSVDESQLMRLDCGDGVVVEMVLADDGTLGHVEVGRGLMASPHIGQPHLIPAGWFANHFHQLLVEHADLKTVVKGKL